MKRQKIPVIVDRETAKFFLVVAYTHYEHEKGVPEWFFTWLIDLYRRVEDVDMWKQVSFCEIVTLSRLSIRKVEKWRPYSHIGGDVVSMLEYIERSDLLPTTVQ